MPPVIEHDISLCRTGIAARFSNPKATLIKNYRIGTPELILHKLIPEALVFGFIRNSGTVHNKIEWIH